MPRKITGLVLVGCDVCCNLECHFNLGTYRGRMRMGTVEDKTYQDFRAQQLDLVIQTLCSTTVDLLEKNNEFVNRVGDCNTEKEKPRSDYRYEIAQ